MNDGGFLKKVLTILRKAFFTCPQLPGASNHCRDLETPQPFDFLTWLGYAPEQGERFERLVGELGKLRNGILSSVKSIFV
jgi:hypothetical protein